MGRGAGSCDAQLLLLEQKRRLYHVAKDKQRVLDGHVTDRRVN
jgi:hypothetical protein